MIDTDKYEGHTEGKAWKWEGWYGDILVKFTHADKQLIADAPLLLEEVKRLREYNDALLNWMMNHLDRDEDEIKEMIYE